MNVTQHKLYKCGLGHVLMFNSPALNKQLQFHLKKCEWCPSDIVFLKQRFRSQVRRWCFFALYLLCWSLILLDPFIVRLNFQSHTRIWPKTEERTDKFVLINVYNLNLSGVQWVMVVHRAQNWNGRGRGLLWPNSSLVWELLGYNSKIV